MTFRRRWPNVLLAIFCIFSLSVFAFMALAIWLGPGVQAAPFGDPQDIVLSEPLSGVDDPGSSLAVAGANGFVEDEAASFGQAVSHRSSVRNAPETAREPATSWNDAPAAEGLDSQNQGQVITLVDGPPPPAAYRMSGGLLAPDEIPVSSAASLAAQRAGSGSNPAPSSDAPIIVRWTPPGSEPQINGLPLNAFLIMPEEVAANARSIIAHGQMLGRNLRAYSKVGDSTIENPNFMTRFDDGPYDLGEFSYLNAVIDYFAGSHSRQGMAVQRGMHSWSVNDPFWADGRMCLANETPLACEIRLHNPSIIFIRLGSNDRGTPAGFEKNLRQVVEFAIDRGVLPILGTKADRFEGSDINNQIIRRVAAEARVPLWDFDRVARTLPDRGLKADGVHLTVYYAHDYTSPTAYQRGHALHNLSALLVLDTVWRELLTSGE